MGKACGTYGKERVRTKIHTGICWGKPEGKRPLGRPTRRWNNNTDVVKQTGWDGLYWVPLARERTKRWALQRPMKCVEISFSRRTLLHDLIHIS